jgi:serine/threonine protein phosphatase PrpC
LRCAGELICDSVAGHALSDAVRRLPVDALAVWTPTTTCSPASTRTQSNRKLLKHLANSASTC